MPVPSAPTEPVLRAEARVDLDAIRANVQRLRAAAPTAEVMAVVKAEGYGHGLLPSALAAKDAGASWLGVAILDEALALRDSGVEGRILAWLAAPGERWSDAIRADIDVSVSSTWALDEVSSAAETTGRPARVHLKVDTGLGRNGATPNDWPALVQSAAKAQADGTIDLAGLWSHLAYADEPRHPTITAQVAVFRQALVVAEDAGLDPEVRHLANSAATLTLPEAHFDLVRPGIAVYGVSPGVAVGTPEQLGLTPAMTLAARFVAVKRVPAGQGVSYGHQYVTTAETTLGLVPLGYADGIPRNATNVGPVLAAGRRRTIAGRVCMDQFVLDLDGDDVAAGDEVLLFGPGTNGEPTAEDWALATGTIGYEIVTRIGARVPRVYVGESG
ncbi:MAG: alanine racemase [Candidatus Nanopelagicales bacterium]